ncbi:hypothetical protein XENOCAPTIV_008503 [Xenoophorus captivus]|uniref:VWFA domain-containing protein n=1 Tax=Xenoophorus captivus TaxID=1517983 RepID=A0ABV0RTV2_9TELE
MEQSALSTRSCLLRWPTSCFGATSGKQDRPLDPEQQCSHGLFTSPAVNLAPYELNFQLLVRGACLLAGTVTLMQAYEYIQRMRADMRGTNLQGALSWLYQQPMQRSYPRQVFIITDGSISNVAKVLELVRRNTCAGRYWPEPTEEHIVTSFSTLLQLIKSLKKAFEPVLTDVRIDWYLPENMEALLSPNEIPPVYPGDHLVGYCTLYDMTDFKRVSFDQTLGGRLDESDGETRPPSRGVVSHRSLTDSNGLLFPASPLEWDSLTDPEYLFTASQPEDPPRGQCRSIIHGLLSGKPVSWEVTVDVGHLWPTEDQDITGVNECGIGGEDVGKPWEEIIHHLTARSVIRDFEKLAEKECDTGHGIAR